MKIRYLKLKNWLMLSVMGLLGLSACSSNKGIAKSEGDKPKEPTGVDQPAAVPMYGVPPRTLQTIDSDVADNQQGTPDTTAKPPKNVVPPQAREPQVTVYGVPTVDFCVTGRVVDAAGKPVKGLMVTLVDSRIDPDNLPDNEYWNAELARMSDTSDAKGTFEVRGTDRPWEEMRVLVRDIDGTKNGSFQSQLVDVKFGEPESGDKPVSKWKLGEKKAEVTIKMKRKK